jgi:hypothetical protein
MNRSLSTIDRLGHPRTRRVLFRVVGGSTLTLGIFATVLVGLAVTVVAVSGVIVGVRAAATQLASAPPKVALVSGTVTEPMVIQTGKMDGRKGWPRFTNSSWTVKAGQTVVLEVTNYDDGTAPLMGSQSMYSSVMGTSGGSEAVDGQSTSSMAPEDVSHTFTVLALGLNLPIPAAPSGGSVTVVARFVPKKTGTFLWQCYAPCGSGTNGMGGAMSTAGWMEGYIRVVA